MQAARIKVTPRRHNVLRAPQRLLRAHVLREHLSVLRHHVPLVVLADIVLRARVAAHRVAALIGQAREGKIAVHKTAVMLTKLGLMRGFALPKYALSMV